MEVKVKNVTFGNKLPLALICGPCQIESREHTLGLAEKLKVITERLGIGFIFKASYDKANRTSVTGKRGVGLEKGLAILDEVRKTFDIPVITDVHEAWHCEKAAKAVDILQVPAFLCRQTDLVVAAAGNVKGFVKACKNTRRGLLDKSSDDMSFTAQSRYASLGL